MSADGKLEVFLTHLSHKMSLLHVYHIPAAALNYGLFRQNSFNTTSQYVMFYDMGAVSTTATVVGMYDTSILW